MTIVGSRCGGRFALAWLLLVFHGGVLADDDRPSPEWFVELADTLSPQLQAGDFVFRRGYGLVSDQIVRLLGEPRPLSHSGVVVEGTNGDWQVIHTISSALSEVDGLRIEPLADFFQSAQRDSVYLVRLVEPSGHGQHMAAQAVQFLQEGRPFDHAFQLDTHALYCTELLWVLLPATVRVQASRLHPTLGILLFDNFFDERFFKILPIPSIP